MPRTVLPFAVADITALARSLRGQLAAAEAIPSHLTLLNMLARAAGYRNFQHFRAETAPAATPLAAPSRPAPPEPVEPALDERALARVVRYFDASGRLITWPSKRGAQLVCLWGVWAALPARRVFSEYDITRWLADRNLFGDPTLLRRELCDQGMLSRTPDCREYQRVERQPPPEGLALIRRLPGGQAGQAVAP